jgi:biopolymer transport protein ExbD
MIDVVFLLLIFFIMTFKITAPEGDFRVKMPRGPGHRASVAPPENLPINVRLEAAGDGRLVAIRMGGRTLNSLDELRREIRTIVDARRVPGADAAPTEVELDCDYHLKYEHAMDAITAVTGYVERGEIVKLADSICFHRRPGH